MDNNNIFRGKRVLEKDVSNHKVHLIFPTCDRTLGICDVKSKVNATEDGHCTL